MSLKQLFSAFAATTVACAAIATAGETRTEQATRAARAHLKQQGHKAGLSPSDLGDLAVSSVVPSKHNGVTHVYLQQRHAGIEVHGAIATVNVAADRPSAPPPRRPLPRRLPV